VQREIHRVAAVPDSVSRARRLVPIAVAGFPIASLLLVSVTMGSVASSLLAQRPDAVTTTRLMLSAFTIMGVALVVACSIGASLVVPGGVLTRMLGLAVIARRGREIGRLRSLARAVVAWSPALVWLGYVAMSPRIHVWIPVPGSPVLALSLMLVSLVAGALWTALRPARGPHDWLLGTRVVPR
jgi:hypothetical protein